MPPAPLDVRGYVDLTLLDVTATTLVERAVLDARSKLPEWQPREGNTETVLLEGMALEVAEAVYALNRLPDTLAEFLLRLYGLTRDPGAAPTATARLIVGTTTGTTIPAGVRLRLTGPAGTLPLELETTAALTIAAGSTEGTVGVRGLDPTDEHNGTAAGTALTVVDATPYLERAELAAALTGGRAPETGEQLLDRGVARLTRLTSALVLPAHFTARALEDARVRRAVTVDLYDPAATTGGPGDHPGNVTVAVLGPGGALLPVADRTDLRGQLAAEALASLAVHVIDATVTAVDVTTTVVATAGADLTAVRAACETALRDYLNPDTWTFGGTVYRNEIIALLDRVDGVSRVADVTTPAGDVALTGVAPLPRAGTLTVTVTAA